MRSHIREKEFTRIPATFFPVLPPFRGGGSFLGHEREISASPGIRVRWAWLILMPAAAP